MKQYQEVLDFWFSDEVVPVQFAEDPDWMKRSARVFWTPGRRPKTDSFPTGVRIFTEDSPRSSCWISFPETSGETTAALSQDGMTVVLAQEAVKQPEYEKLTADEKKFILLPFMHSESLGIHEQAVPLFKELNDPRTLEFEQMHVDVLREYGRYPYQNRDLGRESTPAEREFLERTAGKAYGDGKQ